MKPGKLQRVLYCFGFDVETYHHVTLTLHSLFQSKMADCVDFLDGDDLGAILDILEADEEMEEEFINEVENVSTYLLFWRKRAENGTETRALEYERIR